MRVRVIALVLLSLSLVAVIGALRSKSNVLPSVRSVPMTQVKEDPRTLEARAKKQKAKGETKVVLSAPVPIYAETNGIDEASAEYLVVVAKLMEAKSLTLDPYTFTTYYKFRIIEKMSSPTIIDSYGPQASDLPADLPKLNSDEIYVRMSGGKAVIDGVEVIQEGEFSFEHSETYLLFLLPDISSVISTIPLGPYGVFKVKGDTVDSILSVPHTLDSEIKKKFGKSLMYLKADLLKRSKKP